MNLSLAKWFYSNFYSILIFSIIVIIILAILLYVYRDSFFGKKVIELFLFDPAKEVKLKNYKRKTSKKDNSDEDSLSGDGAHVKKDEISTNGKESKGEIICRKVAEILFNKKFDKVRPEILKNDVTKHNLELDIYNDELKLAIEYSGRQHYEYVPFFHKNYEAFLNQRYRDEMKKNKCKEAGITLIEVPYKIKHEEIPQFIKTKSIELGFLKSSKKSDEKKDSLDK